MSEIVPTAVAVAGTSAQCACFAMIARASYAYFRQKPSVGHLVTRLASLIATLAFTGMALAGPPVAMGCASSAIVLAALSGPIPPPQQDEALRWLVRPGQFGDAQLLLAPVIKK